MNALAQAVARRSLAFAQELAQPYSVGSMNSLVLVERYGGWDADAGEYDDAAASVIYDDPDFPGLGARAGITPTQGPITSDFGDEPVYQDSINLYLPKSAFTHETLPMIDDHVTVLASPDPQFSGRAFKVTSVVGSGRLVASVHLTAVGTAPSRTTQT